MRVAMTAALAAVLAACPVLVAVVARAQPAAAKPSGFFNVRDYGAASDGKAKSTEAIRKAIAAAAGVGGGTIYFPPGQYLTGPIHLRSNTSLFLDAGAVVKFSTDFDDYLPMVRSRWEGTEVMNFSPLIYADGARNLAIQGRGVLDGQGEAWWKVFRALKDEEKRTGVWRTDSKWQREFARLNSKLELPDDARMLQMGFLRPPFIQLLDSRDVLIEDVTIRNSPFWTINPVYCDNVTVRGVTIDNPDSSPNTDGIDPESCRNVHISDCHINAGDDCITIKSGRDRQARRINRPAENYTITNCTMLHGHGGVVIGSEMSGGVSQIAISNSVFDGTDRGIRIKSTRGRGGVVENVRVSNIVMRNIRDEAITLNVYHSDVPPEPLSDRTPRFRNIHISGVTGSATQAGLLVGLAESPLQNVSIEDVNLIAKQGFTIRDANDIRLRGVRVDTEAGPAFIAERVENLQLSEVGTVAPHAATPVVELADVKHALVRGCFAAPGTDGFLRVRGRGSEAIFLDGNDLLGAKTPVSVAQEVKPRTVVGSPPRIVGAGATARAVAPAPGGPAHATPKP
jgi:hypothetical protein